MGESQVPGRLLVWLTSFIPARVIPGSAAAHGHHTHTAVRAAAAAAIRLPRTEVIGPSKCVTCDYTMDLTTSALRTATYREAFPKQHQDAAMYGGQRGA